MKKTQKNGNNFPEILYVRINFDGDLKVLNEHDITLGDEVGVYTLARSGIAEISIKTKPNG